VLAADAGLPPAPPLPAEELPVEGLPVELLDVVASDVVVEEVADKVLVEAFDATVDQPPVDACVLPTGVPEGWPTSTCGEQEARRRRGKVVPRVSRRSGRRMRQSSIQANAAERR
jgi:hypothetical protein